MPLPTPRPKLLTFAAAAGLIVILWGLAKSTPKRVELPSIRVLAISDTGQWMASGTSNGQIHLCDIRNRIPVCQTFQSIGTLNDLRFSPDDSLLAIADRNIRLIPLAHPDKPLTVQNDTENYGSVRFSSDGHFILTINGKGAIMTVELHNGKATHRFCCSSIWGDVEFITDSQVLWAGHWPGVWDLRSGGLIGRLTETREFMTFGPIATDLDRQVVYLGSQDSRVHQWGLHTYKPIRKSPSLSGYVRTISVLGTTGWIAYSNGSVPVHLWHPNTGASRVVQVAYTTSNLVFDESRQQTAIGTPSGAVEFWDLLAARVMSTIPAIRINDQIP